MDFFSQKISTINKLIIEKKISIKEIIQMSQMRLSKSKSNAFVYIEPNIQYTNSNSILNGIPIAYKDLFCVKNTPSTSGSLVLKGFIPNYDATIVSTFNSLGTINLGKLAQDEFGMGSFSINSVVIPKNPINLARTAGGSSGGSSASVADNILPIAIGSDTGGSIREPASFCGLTGYKPTYGGISRYGVISYASSLDTVGICARYASDILSIMPSLSIQDKLDSTSISINFNIPEPNKNILFIKQLNDLSPQYFKVLEATRATFESMGYNFKEISIPEILYSDAVYYILAVSEASSNLSRYHGLRYGVDTDINKPLRDYYLEARSHFGFEVKKRIILGNFLLSSNEYNSYYLKAMKVRGLITQKIKEAFQHNAYIMSLTYPTIAPNFIDIKDLSSKDIYMADLLTLPFSLGGFPALSINGGFIDNMPVGIQLVGDHLMDANVLSLASKFQENTDFHLPQHKFSWES